ncbi:MAG: glycosyltransferase, partial [Ruminococcaceae bacterium]|nr:glycosyltransferase [Oscillospiraceae bacterium]
MKNQNLPKVLVVSTNAWRDNTGINTLIQFFKCWDRDRIAQIYTKSALPKTQICNKFFRISENSVIKSVFKRSIVTGQKVENENNISDKNKTAADSEQKLYTLGGKKFSGLLGFCREIVWKIGKWKTRELDRFIEEFEPDVLFIPIYPTIYMGRIQRYIIKKTGKPVISYLADDNYTYKTVSKNPVSLISRFVLRRHVKFIVDNSDKLLVIAPKQKEEYDRIFGVDSEILTKGIDFSQIPFEEKPLNKPIKMVYTGKLIIGRWLSLAAIAKTLGEINKDGIKAELDIYTTDTLTPEQEKALNFGGCLVKGALKLDEVQEVQKNADILVFVESLENKYKNIARLSFSTKITDFLKNGKCIFAIGD